uniref:Uncharacterized protein n=1 Tax=Setaria viridis TaxID=4556 RepID=A0A4V6DDB4_SETVI|nr:hypothetical protein SEVIR_1G285850v2 [Setaria viridis]
MGRRWPLAVAFSCQLDPVHVPGENERIPPVPATVWVADTRDLEAFLFLFTRTTKDGGGRIGRSMPSWSGSC